MSMLFSIRSRAWLLALLLPLSAQAGEVNKYLPNETDFILVLNVKQFLNSPLVQKHALADLKTMLKANSETAKHLEALGFDPFKDLTSVTMGVSMGKGKEKGLVIARGAFDLAKFEQNGVSLAKDKPGMLKIHSDGSRTVYEFKPEQGGDKPVFAALLDNTTIVASNDRQYVTDALRNAPGTSGNLKKDLQSLIEKTDTNQSLWFVVPSSSLLDSEAANNPDAKKLLEKVDNVTGGLAVNNDVKLQIDFAAKGAEAAKEIAEALKGYLDQFKGLAAIMASNQKELAPAVEIMDALKLETAGNTVTIKAHASRDAIEKSLKNK